MANIRDVAKHAGVAIATVSATLNESRSGQRGNPQARVGGGRGRRLHAERDRAQPAPRQEPADRHGHLRHHQSVLLIDGADDGEAALAAGYSIIVCNTDDDVKRERAVLAQLRAQHVAGIILTPVGRGADYVRPSRGPQFSADRHHRPQGAGLARDFVGVDNRAAARMLTQYLLRLGHRRIAMITRHGRGLDGEERLAAFLETMEAAGAPVDPQPAASPATIAATPPTRRPSRLMMRADRPTAIIGANNFMALGALQAILDLGFRCPADVSLVGIDDVPWSGLVRPRVVDVGTADRRYRQGRDRLPARTDVGRSRGPHPPRDIVFQPHFLSGDSCASLHAVQVVA